DAGAALEAVHGDALDPVLGDIAHHYFEAAPLGTLSKAIEFATRAGQHAFGQLGYEEAAGHFERALQASRGTAVAAETRFTILFLLGSAQQAAGDQEGAHATLIEAAQVARDLGYMNGLQQALTAASGEETGTVDWTLVRLLEEAIGLLGPRDTRERTMLLAQLSRSLYFADVPRRHAYSEEAVALARRRDDRVALLEALRARQFALWEPGEAARRREIGAEILDLATATRNPVATADAISWRIHDHLELAEMPVVHDTLRRYRELAAACRLPHVRWHVTVVEGALALLAGRLGAARRLAQRAVGLLPASPRNNVQAFFYLQSLLICREEGRVAELAPVVAMAAERAVSSPIWRAALMLLHAELGETDAARQELSDLGTGRFGDVPRVGSVLGTYAGLAEACAILAAPHFAEPLLPLLAPYTDSVIMLGYAAGCIGSAARYAGLLAHTLG